MENLSIELLPVAEEVPAFHPLPVVSHAFDPDRIADVLARITVQRTQHPMIRTVFFAGEAVGRIAQNPYGIGWIASCNRKHLYSSIKDAALACYQDSRGVRDE